MSISTSTTTAQSLNYVMGTLVAAGGIAGFASAGSQASLISGVAIGALYGISGYINQPLMGAAVSVVLAMFMGDRYMKTNKVMPAGMLAVLGAGAAVYNIYLSQHASAKLKF